jgi:hypothetical protein
MSLSKDICNNTTKIIKGLNSLELMRKFIVIDNKISNISLEEVVKDKWSDIKSSLNNVNKLLEYDLKKKNLYKLPDIKDLIIFIIENIKDKKHTPKTFCIFLNKLLKRKNIKENIKLLKILISDKELCLKSFSKV